jgi:hypothetical protein
MPMFILFLKPVAGGPNTVEIEADNRIAAISALIDYWCEEDLGIRKIEFCFQSDDPAREQVVFAPSQDNETAHWHIDLFAQEECKSFVVETDIGNKAVVGAQTSQIALYRYLHSGVKHRVYEFGYPVAATPITPAHDD